MTDRPIISHEGHAKGGRATNGFKTATPKGSKCLMLRDRMVSP